MHHKNIKLIIQKQLKKQFPNWKRLGRKQKRDIARKVLSEVVAEYDFKQDIDAPAEELLGINGQVPKGVIRLDEMTRHIDMINKNSLLQFSSYKRSPVYIKDEELAFVDGLIDNTIINRLLAYEGYSPSMRDITLANLFRAELLKVIKYPEISYRKFCTEEYLGLDRKQNRVFVGLPLHKKTMIDHSQLSTFRSSLSFTRQINLLVYILHHFFQSNLLGDSVLHGIDSTELANDCRSPLASLDINGTKIRIYNDMDCDCGKRRNKRDKSPYVIGYRMHTLTVIDVQTGQTFPLVSLLAPANHHDSHFLPFVVNLAQAMGINIKLITADEAYHDKDGTVHQKTGVIVTTPPLKKVTNPKNVDSATGSVFCHNECATPMQHVGTEGHEHEYKCGAEQGECSHQHACPQCRFLPMDRGLFQRIPFATESIQQAHDIRKNCERPFNSLKNQTGLETVRVRSQHATIARCTLSSIAVILIKMAGTRRKQKKTDIPRQQHLFADAA